MDTFTHDGLRFDVIDGGPDDGAPVVLLHGFPQDASAWSQVSQRLQAAGLRTLAPHQRGYSSGARPRRATAYRMDLLVGDVVALLDAAGIERAHVVGHDWGGGVAWVLAGSRPERVASLTVLSTPHPAALASALRHSDQLRKSWYMVAFQLPWLPERGMARMLRTGGLARSGVPAEHDRRYAERLGRAGDLTGPINWYRAGMRPRLAGLRPGRKVPAGVAPSPPVTLPTTYLWGSRDPFLGRAAAERTARHAGEDYRFVEVAAGHWLPEREPELVAQQIIATVERSAKDGSCYG
ncbi:MAG: alpha/beta fold hydrolase [Ornithinimicrobium sp.]|uniref:alpha/beta fold hydrolase n=1 Tax=Ornithinimicrobium sp. TaxID=1977084 RepID=UPI0026DF3614|nr:alpha/beta fold hydrolase [Ornithinimicrobium sp.]MDO5740226.1 alpha/beta fold hydrolase [Ornithinimicrobium sp.]